MVVVVVRLYAEVVLFFAVLNEENPFEEFRINSESTLISSPVSSKTLVLSLRGNEKQGNYGDNESYGGDFQETCH